MTSTAQAFPGGAIGRRLLPETLDELARTMPDRLYASIPHSSSDISSGYLDVTIGSLAQAAAVMTHWIEKRWGLSDTFETICFIGVQDLRPATAFHAIVRCGYKLLLVSPRNPPEANVSLLEQTGCCKLLYAKEVHSIVKNLHELKKNLEIQEIPSFAELLGSEASLSPFRREFHEARDDPVLVLHSSGSTGLPKPITMTHGSFAVLDNDKNLPGEPGREKRDFTVYELDGSVGRIFALFPYYHLAGFLALTVCPLFAKSCPVFWPALVAPSVELVKQVIGFHKLKSLALPPAMAEQLLQEPKGLDYFRDLYVFIYTGAPLTHEAGEEISRVTRLCPMYGSTEVFNVAQLVPAREDWEWIEWNPHVPLQMMPADEPETFELVLYADGSCHNMHTAFCHNLPGSREFRTRDLFRRHPTKSYLWKYAGRRDDIIVLSSGEKFNPIPLEVAVQAHRQVIGALVTGKHRTQPALILEPKSLLPGQGKGDILRVDDVWPLIRDSNSMLPGQGRVAKSKILMGSRPFVRAPKGSIVRKLTEDLYAKEIDQLYSSDGVMDQAESAGAILRPTKFDLPSIEGVIRTTMALSFPIAATLDGRDDFFGHGLDSITCLEITNSLKVMIRGAVGVSNLDLGWLTTSTVFYLSNLLSLSEVIHRFLNDRITPDVFSRSQHLAEVQGLIRQYTPRLLPSGSHVDPNHSVSVAIIGSNGYLGTHIVAALLQSPRITQIFCLNRGPCVDAQRKQEASLTELGLATPEKLSQLRYFEISAGQPALGLSKAATKMLLDHADSIVFNAWKVNFTLPVRSFEPLLHAVAETASLAAQGRHRPRVVFVSSVSSMSRWTSLHADSPIPEAPVHDVGIIPEGGYASSKFAAESILAAVHEEGQVPVTIIRVGQIAGPSQGGLACGKHWADGTWVGALIEACMRMKCAPVDLPTIDWLPVDSVASTMVQAALEPGGELSVGNAVHPRRVDCQVLIQVVQQLYGPLELVSLARWIEKVNERSDVRNSSEDSRSAIMLLDWFSQVAQQKGPPTYETRCLHDLDIDIPDLTPKLLEGWLSDLVLQDVNS